jgi:hypothetical protein
MSQSQIEDIVGTLLTAPVKAVTYANREQMYIWRDYLKTISALIDIESTQDEKVSLVKQYLSMAPIWKVSATVEVGITMRIASVSKSAKGGSIGLAVGLLQVAGQFSSESSTTSESVMTAKAIYALSNDKEIKLTEFMSTLGVTVTSPDQVVTAIGKLENIIDKDLPVARYEPQAPAPAAAAPAAAAAAAP